LDIIISSFCNVLLCSVLKLFLGVDCYPFKPQGFSIALNQYAIWMSNYYYNNCNALHLEMSC